MKDPKSAGRYVEDKTDDLLDDLITKVTSGEFKEEEVKAAIRDLNMEDKFSDWLEDAYRSA